ncbi:MAG: hypothetical protein KY461_01260 [Actinobacteria bacterium]|nr:hypothetical protein [Actinomycetota bacterium]
MTVAPVARWHRVLAATVASVLFLASVLGISRARQQAGDRPVAAAPESSPTPTPPPRPGTAPPTPAPTATAEPRDPALALADPDAAAALGADRLLAAGLAAAQGPWRDLGDAAWPTRNERPVYVGAVALDDDGGRVTADLVVATRLSEPAGELVLRLLPGARALGDGTGLTVTATVDGDVTEAVVDRDGARLVVPLGRERGAGEAVLLRFDVTYDLVTVGRIVDDGGPAAFGLLASHPVGATLGHWLPLLTLPGEDGAMVPWGDVGGFPVAIWSLRTVHDGTLVTGGADGDCPEPAAGGRACTWSRGIALRDVSAVLYHEEPVTAATDVAGIRHRAVAAVGTAAAAEAVLGEVVGAAVSFGNRFGALAWNEVDTVAVPLGRGAAGMEFPGLSLIDDEQWTEIEGGFGTAVIAHEIAHQWFHALVGNGSLSSPVVDESLAQYLSYLYWQDTYGPAAARAYAQRSFLDRYEAARARGVRDEAPAQPVDAFPDAETYGVMVYARAPLAWVAAEDELGAEAVEAFLGQVVSRYGLDTVSDRQLVEDAFAFDPELGAILQRAWFTDEPLA